MIQCLGGYRNVEVDLSWAIPLIHFLCALREPRIHPLNQALGNYTGGVLPSPSKVMIGPILYKSRMLGEEPKMEMSFLIFTTILEFQGR